MKVLFTFIWLPIICSGFGFNGTSQPAYDLYTHHDNGYALNVRYMLCEVS